MVQISSVQAVSMHLHPKIHTNGFKLLSTESTQISHTISHTLISNQTVSDDKHKKIVQQIQDDEFFYPLVMINDEMIGEGYIQLKPVFAALEKNGYIAES